MVQGIEKREAIRAPPLGTKVKWTVDDENWYTDESRDVSSSGMMLLTKEEVEPGSKIKLIFNLPNLKFIDPITVEAKVTRIIQRNQRQQGVGLQFITLKSQNYAVVQEFVCRILGVPLGEVMEEIGGSSDIGYSFTMERLAREADKKRIQSLEKKLEKQDEKRKKESSKLWLQRGTKAGLFALLIYILAKAYSFFANLLSSLHGGGR